MYVDCKKNGKEPQIEITFDNSSPFPQIDVNFGQAVIGMSEEDQRREAKAVIEQYLAQFVEDVKYNQWYYAFGSKPEENATA